MSPCPQTTTELDLHRLEPRYEATRVLAPKALNALVRSMEQVGQLVPLTAVAEQERYVLIDGYLRVKALRRCGRDTAQVSCWDCPVQQALLLSLAHQQARQWEALEEAQLIRLLCDDGVSQHAIARQSGRDVSWVNRRLQLLEGMSDEIREALRQGWLTTWSATRVLIPLARANSEHAQWLLAALKQAPLPSRVLHELYRQYGRSDKQTREHLVRHPQLFHKAQQAQLASREAARLRQGPEGEWTEKLAWIDDRLKHLRRQIPLVFTDTLTPSQHQALIVAFQRTQRAWQHLAQAVAQQEAPAADHPASAQGEPHAVDGARTDHPRPAPARGGDTSDQSAAQDLPQRGAPGGSPGEGQTVCQSIGLANR